MPCLHRIGYIAIPGKVILLVKLLIPLEMLNCVRHCLFSSELKLGISPTSIMPNVVNVILWMRQPVLLPTSFSDVGVRTYHLTSEAEPPFALLPTHSAYNEWKSRFQLSFYRLRRLPNRL